MGNQVFSEQVQWCETETRDLFALKKHVVSGIYS